MNELKELNEKRDELLGEMEQLTNEVKLKKRAFTEEETTKFESLRTQVEEIDKTVETIEKARSLQRIEQPKIPETDMTNEGGQEAEEELQMRAFANVIRNRADKNITKTDNGAVIPKTIANKIIDKVKDISPLFRDAEKYNVKGIVSIPYVDEASDNIKVAYAPEFTDLEAKDAKLMSIDLTGYLAGVLTKVSVSLINSADRDLVAWVISKMAAAVAEFMDKEILVGTSGKITGLSTATNVKTAKAADKITADELITLRNSLKSVYQSGAYWVMAPDTLTAVQKLKDNNGRYLFNDDIVEGFSGKILGKPVYTTDQAPAMAAGKNAIFYLNPAAGLAVKLVEDSVQVLREKYATQHAIGVVAWVEADAKVQNQQAVAVLKMATA
mgnify:CR=1 FL=1